jgi:hypothetical protein
LSEHAVLRGQVLIEEMSEDALVVHESGKALGDLAILRVEELPQEPA